MVQNNRTDGVLEPHDIVVYGPDGERVGIDVKVRARGRADRADGIALGQETEAALARFLTGGIKLGDILDNMPSFEVPLKKEASVRALLNDLGIKPMAKKPPLEGGRGIVAYFDPIICWVLATYYHSPVKGLEAHAATLHARRVHHSRGLIERLGAEEPVPGSAARIFIDWFAESDAYLSYVLDPEYGMDIRLLRRFLANIPGLIDLSLRGRQLFDDALDEYVAYTVSDVTGFDVPVDAVRLADRRTRKWPQYSFERYGAQALLANDESHKGWAVEVLVSSDRPQSKEEDRER